MAVCCMTSWNETVYLFSHPFSLMNLTSIRWFPESLSAILARKIKASHCQRSAKILRIHFFSPGDITTFAPRGTLKNWKTSRSHRSEAGWRWPRKVEVGDLSYNSCRKNVHVDVCRIWGLPIPVLQGSIVSFRVLIVFEVMFGWKMFSRLSGAASQQEALGSWGSRIWRWL